MRLDELMFIYLTINELNLHCEVGKTNTAKDFCPHLPNLKRVLWLLQIYDPDNLQELTREITVLIPMLEAIETLCPWHEWKARLADMLNAAKYKIRSIRGNCDLWLSAVYPETAAHIAHRHSLTGEHYALNDLWKEVK